jgi:hypothetical protein
MGLSHLTLTLPEEMGVDAEDLIRLINARPNRFRVLPKNRLRIYTGRFTLPDDLPKIEKTVKMLDFKAERSETLPGQSRAGKKYV